ncbi:MAG: hypothetical protein ACXVI6_06300 [Candidatus Aminicenantales bacterium]
MKKRIAIALFLIAAGSLSAQSVVELSRQEKARREGFKGNRVRVVTNFDLTAVRKTPAVTIVPDLAAEPNSAEEDREPSAGLGSNGANAAPVRTIVPNVLPSGPTVFASGDSSDPASSASARTPEARLKAANEQVDLLTDKMNILLQESNNLNTMTPRDVIMQQIDDTSQKLAKAQDEVARLKAQIEAGKKTPQDKH